MRTVRSVLAVLVIAFVAAASAAAASGPVWPVHIRTTPPKAASPVEVVVMTLAALPDYPWVQPVFGRKGVPTARAALARPLHPGVQPVWVKVGGLTLPALSR